MERSKCLCSDPSLLCLANGAHRIEVAVKQILSGMSVKTNASVANPEALAWFAEWAVQNP